MKVEDGEPLLTVIVPVYNEARTVDLLLRRVLAAPYDKQVVVVDDGSTDGTAAILHRWAAKGDRSNLPERPDQPPVGARCFAQIGPVPFSEPRVTWALSLLCFGGFALISLYKGISGEATCGCFGRVPVNPWYTLTLDATAVLALLRWRPRGLPHSHIHTFSRSATILALCLLAGTPVALATWSEPAGTLTDLGEVLAGGRIVVLKPETWVGASFPLIRFIDIGSQLSHGSWTVVLYHHDCPECQKVIRRYGRESQGGSGPGVALVAVPPYGPLPDDCLPSRSACVLGRLNANRDWFCETPVFITLSNGIVKGLLVEKS